ncbi:hypothetical protein KI688_005740 [Linnemannia hyalina]|uniref:Uncharacterized protein n=1 Tax=Linnemannia hyalina TaxID=64524 RepID=A0A9P8BXN7_9FUNG|nr:hypothetical protein KI688_005740 [Linnemannia hyalina]
MLPPRYYHYHAPIVLKPDDNNGLLVDCNYCMSKRSSGDCKENHSEPEGLALEEINAETRDKAFAKIITDKAFGTRPTCIEEWGVQYIAQMRLNPQPTVEGLLAHIRIKHPRAKAKTALMWSKLKSVFCSCDEPTLLTMEKVTDVQAFIEAFQAESSDQDDQNGPVGASTAVVQASSALGSSSTSKPSTSSSSVSNSSALSAGTILKMNSEFDHNFAAFVGEAWMLPSGACADEVVAQYVRTLSKESALHSFVVDMPSTIIDLFNDHKDKAALSEVLVTRAGERQKVISTAEEEHLRLYDEEPDKVEEKLSQGWQSVSAPEDQVLEKHHRGSIHLALHLIFLVYQRHHFELPQSASESFYLQILWGVFPTLILSDRTLHYRPAEVHSQASSLRKNRNRKAEGTVKQAVGRKADGLIVSSSTMLELCMIEAANKDVGLNGTKALHDTRKMAKVLKDTFDGVCAKTNKDVIDQLVVFGARIAGSSMTFYSMRKRQGRFYQLADDGTVTFPSQWDRSTTMNILTIIASVLALRKRVTEMAKQVTAWTTLSFEPLDTSSHPNMPVTLTTPPGSPRLSPRQ